MNRTAATANAWLIITAAAAALAATPASAAALAAGQFADPVSEGQWFHAFLRTSQAHTISTGQGVTVAVLDSGVDANHPDLAGSIIPGPDFTVDSPGSTVDTHGHGTAMAGMIVAHGRVKGIAPQARVLTVKVGATERSSSDTNIAKGIDWAAAQGVGVISISLGGTDGLLLRQTIERVVKQDIVVVAAAGNRPQDSSVTYPAAYPGVVAVAGVGRDGNHSAVSVTGPQVVIAAPGDQISSTDRAGGYASGSGTSSATAIVAGAAALIRAKYPHMEASEVIRRITATAVDKGPPGRDNEYGYGVIDIVAALNADLPTPTKATPSAPTQPPSTNDGKPWWWPLALPAAALIILIIAGSILLRRRRT